MKDLSQEVFENFPDRLKMKLKDPLPGLVSHLKLAPLIRISDLQMLNYPEHAVESAVLFLLFKKANQLNVVFIQRPEYDGVHSGQIALPGGKTELSDPDFIYTALRETHEEIGFRCDIQNVLGVLSQLYIPPSNFIVKPVVAFVHDLPQFVPQPEEVANIIMVPLADLLNKENLTESYFLSRGNDVIKAPCYSVSGVKIWGATAMIVSEFIDICDQVLNTA